jgi:glucose-1-phosphate thymidylyltransferase
MLAGVNRITIICRQGDLNLYENSIGDGSQWGLLIDYVVQKEALGIAHGLKLACEKHSASNYMLVLGDNFIYGGGIGRSLSLYTSLKGATCLAYQVDNPSSYGVVSFDEHGNPHAIVEKPVQSNSKWAIPGIYFFDSTVLGRLRSLKVSARNEYEITELLTQYIFENQLQVVKLSRGIAWLDLGSISGIHRASNFVEAIENTQEIMIACLEEIALEMGWVEINRLRKYLGEFDGEYKNRASKQIERQEKN